MANGLNRVLLVGNLGADAELKHTQGGQAVARLRIATTESYVDKAGEKQERTDWHSCTFWGKRAEALARYLTKGTTVWVEGKLQTRSWDDKDGQKRYATEVNVQDIGLLGGGQRGAGGPQGGGAGGRSGGSSGGRGGAPAHDEHGEYGGAYGDPNDEIPF